MEVLISLRFSHLNSVHFNFEERVLIVLGFNKTSTLEGHFVSSPREREKRERRESRREETVEEMKERDREERGTGMKVKKQKK